MNTTQLASALANSTGLPVATANEVVRATFGLIADELVSGEDVQVSGFGTFRTSVRGARTGRNPQTGEPITIDEMRVPAFKASSTLKARVRG